MSPTVKRLWGEAALEDSSSSLERSGKRKRSVPNAASTDPRTKTWSTATPLTPNALAYDAPLFEHLAADAYISLSNTCTHWRSLCDSKFIAPLLTTPQRRLAYPECATAARPTVHRDARQLIVRSQRLATRIAAGDKFCKSYIVSCSFGTATVGNQQLWAVGQGRHRYGTFLFGSRRKGTEQWLRISDERLSAFAVTPDQRWAAGVGRGGLVLLRRRAKLPPADHWATRWGFRPIPRYEHVRNYPGAPMRTFLAADGDHVSLIAVGPSDGMVVYKARTAGATHLQVPGAHGALFAYSEPTGSLIGAFQNGSIGRCRILGRERPVWETVLAPCDQAPQRLHLSASGSHVAIVYAANDDRANLIMYAIGKRGVRVAAQTAIDGRAALLTTDADGDNVAVYGTNAAEQRTLYHFSVGSRQLHKMDLGADVCVDIALANASRSIGAAVLQSPAKASWTGLWRTVPVRTILFQPADATAQSLQVTTLHNHQTNNGRAPTAAGGCRLIGFDADGRTLYQTAESREAIDNVVGPYTAVLGVRVHDLT